MQKDGTDKLLSLAGGKLYEIAKATGAITERFDLTGAGEGSFATYRNKAWLANGTKTVKLENETASQVGISAPAAAGGSSAAPPGCWEPPALRSGRGPARDPARPGPNMS